MAEQHPHRRERGRGVPGDLVREAQLAVAVEAPHVQGGACASLRRQAGPPPPPVKEAAIDDWTILEGRAGLHGKAWGRVNPPPTTHGIPGIPIQPVGPALRVTGFGGRYVKAGQKVPLPVMKGARDSKKQPEG